MERKWWICISFLPKEPLKTFIKSGIFLSRKCEDLLVFSVGFNCKWVWSIFERRFVLGEIMKPDFSLFFSEVEYGDRWLSTKTRNRKSAPSKVSENVSWPCSASHFNPVAEINVGIVHFCKQWICWYWCLLDFSFQFHLVWQCCAYGVVRFSTKISWWGFGKGHDWAQHPCFGGWTYPWSGFEHLSVPWQQSCRAVHCADLSLLVAKK